MKILLDLQGCQSKGSRNRGIGRYSIAFARALLREGTGHEFHILLNGAFPDSIAPIEQELAGALPPGRVHVFQAPAGCADDRSPPRWRTLAAPAIRRCAIQQVRPDLVHVSSLFEGLGDDSVAAIDPALDGVPTSVTVYDFIPYLNAERYLAGSATRGWYMRRFESMKRAALLLGISQSACAEAEKVMPDRLGRVVNISSASDPLRFFPAPAGDAARRLGLTRPFVMYTGGIDWRKNVEGLIQAFAALPRPLRDRHQLAIVCHVEKYARTLLRSCARKAGLGPEDMVLTGFVSDEDLADLYRGCELFVFPSLHEGFGLPALEAMMCGAAVIGSNTSSIPEVIGRDDAMFDPRSQPAITAVMQRALEDSAFRASLKAHASVQAAQFSWDRCARTALAAMEELHAQRRPASPVRMPPARPRLAMVAPLPPVESGIAQYTAELVPALAEHYDIELVHHQAQVQLPPALAHLPVHDIAAFGQNAARYDRVVYQFGNSTHHAFMFGLLRDVRGTVVLHDFFLGGPLNWLEKEGGVPDAFRQALLRSHGPQALEFDRERTRGEAMAHYPANRFVLERAQGVIVHSQHSIEAAQRWYGPGYARDWRRIPHLRTVPPMPDRDRARDGLGFATDEFIVCSFGHLNPNKLNHRLLQAWLASTLARDPRCRLVLVGAETAPPYGDEVMRLVAQGEGRIAVTGYASRDDYERHLAAADLAVQLRTMSRGETSGAVLDCLACGVPLVANAHGSTAEYPADVLRLLPDEFTDAELVAALDQLRVDDNERRRLASAGRAHVAKLHDPTAIAREYRDAIEAFAGRPQHAAYWEAVAAIGALGVATERDLEAAAVALEATWQRPPA
jgi:glycosyltransferase involved in cell wall biosynthesis